MIEVSLTNKTGAASNGMRYWIDYVRSEVAAAMKGVTGMPRKENTHVYRMGDTITHFTLVIDPSNLVVTMRAEAFKPDGSPSLAVPVPGLLIIMVALYLVVGRARAGSMVPLVATIGPNTYTSREQTPEVYAQLHRMLPKPWYLPYTANIKDNVELLSKK